MKISLALLLKICFWTQITKIKCNLSFNQSESRIKDLRLIFLTCVQTQILCNGAYVAKFEFNDCINHL